MHMHEPQWSGVRRMTHFDRYEVVMLSPHKAADIDKVNSQLLCIVAPVIAPVVARLINFSFSSGSFPSCWKTAKVSPLYKNGDSRDVQNF